MVRRSPPRRAVLAPAGPPPWSSIVRSQRTGPPGPPTMSIVLDIGQGAGLASRHGRAPVPAPAPGGRAGARGHRPGLRQHRLAVPGEPGLPGGRPGPGRGGLPGRARRRGPPHAADRARGRGRGAGRRCCSRARWPRATARRWPASWAAWLCAAAGVRSRWAGCSSAPAARLDDSAAGLLAGVRRRRRAGAGGHRDLRPAGGVPGADRASSCCSSAGAAGATRSTRACGSCGERAGEAQEARPRGDRRARSPRRSSGRSRRAGRPTLAAMMERGTYVRRLRVDVPLGHAGGGLGDRHRARARPST